MNYKLDVMEVLNCTSKLNRKECVIYHTLLKRVYKDSLKKLIKIYNLNTKILRLIEKICNIIFSYEVSMI